jgi:hypothetical protein
MPGFKPGSQAVEEGERNTMKLKLILLLMLCVMATGLTFAAANKKTITLRKSVNVAGTTLPAGDYVVEWIGSGSDVQVTFSHGKNKVATVPARLEATHSPYDAIILRPLESGEQRLVELDSRDSALHFEQSEATDQ